MIEFLENITQKNSTDEIKNALKKKGLHIKLSQIFKSNKELAKLLMPHFPRINKDFTVDECKDFDEDAKDFSTDKIEACIRDIKRKGAPCSNEIFMAEVDAIDEAENYCIENEIYDAKSISNSRSALMALESVEEERQIIKDIKRKLKSANIQLKWVKAHHGVIGEERADSWQN
ncbi:hypothetical protein AVEN_66749-1 [Araneus ventricosus]|uniref:Uncharacterized protein n=1 Tax=Araneus ventricosus TaxID=182803 RepID=A0A4Y2HRN5_ARAVE|nr:hypothetical protein AVEN_66749-1 [Araneus ventricosus]